MFDYVESYLIEGKIQLETSKLENLILCKVDWIQYDLEKSMKNGESELVKVRLRGIIIIYVAESTPESTPEITFFFFFLNCFEIWKKS